MNIAEAPVEIRECPFAHVDLTAKYRIYIRERKNGQWYLYCDYCRARGPVMESRLDAIEAWQIRAGQIVKGFNSKR